MPRREEWTFLLIPRSHRRVRSFTLSPRLRRIAASLLGVAFILVLGITIGFFHKTYNRVQLTQLRLENQFLRQDLKRLQTKARELTRTLEHLSRRDEEYRLMADLPEIPAEVREVGIGGPGARDLRSGGLYRFDPRLGRAAFATEVELESLLRRAQLLSQSFAEAATRLRERRAEFAARPSIWPTRGYVTSLFSRARLHPIFDFEAPHLGVDISSPYRTPIITAAPGVVVRAGWEPGYGQVVEVDHGYGYRTRYAHCASIRVRPGQRVKRGDIIAVVGSTGIATGPHLHYEVTVNGAFKDPFAFILNRGPTVAIPE